MLVGSNVGVGEGHGEMEGVSILAEFGDGGYVADIGVERNIVRARYVKRIRPTPIVSFRYLLEIWSRHSLVARE